MICLSSLSIANEDQNFSVNERVLKTNPNKGETDHFNEMLTNSDLSTREAKLFQARFEMVDHQVNTATGYAGTFYKEKETNAIHYAIRGTEMTKDGFFSDLMVADIGQIVFQGSAYHHYQLVTITKILALASLHLSV